MILRRAPQTFIFLLILNFTLIAEAKLFRNAYVSFELPPNWSCNLEGTEWVCISKFYKRSNKEAIIILTAKEVGPTDTFQAYMAHLKTPRTLPTKGGKPILSKVLHVRQRRIANHLWVDGMHLGSEVSSYYTRYLATIKDRIAILVTFSAHKAHYTKYSNDFLRAIQSLRVVASKNILGNRKSVLPRQGNETVGVPIGQTLGNMEQMDIPQEESDSDISTSLLGLILLIGAVGLYLYAKKPVAPVRRKKSKRKKTGG